MKSEYTSPYSIAKRQTVYIDVNDPRVRNPIKYGLTVARLGSEFVVVNDATTTPAGNLSSIAGSGGPSYTSKADKFIPTSNNFIKPTAISNLDADWIGSTLSITFDFDFSKEQNKYVQGFKYRLTAADARQTIYLIHSDVDKNSLEQTISFVLDLNRTYFGTPATSFSLLEVFAYDSFGNIGDTATLSVIPSYVTDLPAPIITVTAINQGYVVDWQTITEIYTDISVEEVISDAATAPSTGYETSYLDIIKPARVITSDLQTRWVKARFRNELGYGSYSTAHKVTPESPVVVDNTAPDAPTWSLTGNSAGIDSTGSIGFNGFLNLSWSAILDSTLRGYRIRFRPVASPESNYAYVDSPGTGTTYRLGGLAVGTTYEVGIAAYDQFNNTSSSYTTLSPNLTVSGTPFVGTNVTTTGYFGASAGGDTGEFRFGYGVETGKRGLRFDSNNYWYIDASAAASFRLGGTSSNYLQWNGGTFTIDGDLTARSGTFAGNVQIISGGSLYSGTLVGNSLSGAGYILNNTGLTFNSSSVNGITTINATNGLFTTSSANIGGWLVSPDTNPNTLYKVSGSNTIKLDAGVGAVTASGTGYSAGFGIPDASNIVFWAGSRSTTSPFYITQQGALFATNATLRGKLETGVPGIEPVMAFGASVGDNTENGLHLNSTNYWYTTGDFKVGNGSHFLSWNNSTDILTIRGNLEFGASTLDYVKLNGDFRFGGGILTGTSSSVSINGGEVVLEAVGTVETDNNNFAGDPTLTLNSDNHIVKGRRFIYNQDIVPSTTTPVGSWDSNTRTGIFAGAGGPVNVKTGDILLVLE